MKPSTMINLTLTRSSNNNNKHTSVIGRFKHDARCKRHPKHTQSPGVCSLCLSHKLTQISSSSSSRPLPPASNSSSSVSSLSSDYSSSNSASSSSSPLHPHSSVSFFNANHGLHKSRSLAYVPRHRHSTHHYNNNNNSSATKKTGFFFNLLRPRNKRMPDALLHSRSFAVTHNNNNNVAVPTT